MECHGYNINPNHQCTMDHLSIIWAHFELQMILCMVKCQTHPQCSVYDGNDYGDVDMAINGIIGNSDYDDMFHSLGHNYPWLAIDLGFYYKVILTVEICDPENIFLHLLLGHRVGNGGTEWVLR